VTLSFLEQIRPALAKLFGEHNLSEVDRAVHGYDLRLEVDQQRLTELTRFLIMGGCYLEYITAVDRDEFLELLYVFGRYDEPFRLMAAAPSPKGGRVPSLSGLISAADWQEREIFDMFGQQFTGHPDLRRILLPEDADFHPLLKSFKAGPKHAGDVVNLERK
jgi:NADH-quinone oxidoreductase subunit C